MTLHRPPLIYVAGPYGLTATQRDLRDAYALPSRGMVETRLIAKNVRQAVEAGRGLIRLGLGAVVPHQMFTVYHGEQDEAFFYRLTEEVLCRCDGIFLLPNWKESTGAQMEHKKAVELRLPVMFDHKDVARFMSAWFDETPESPVRATMATGLMGD